MSKLEVRLRPPWNLKLSLAILGQNFTVSQTQYSTLAYTEKASILFSNKYVGRPLVARIGSFRRHVKHNLASGRIKDVKIFRLSETGRMPKEGVELDIDRAYATAAWIIGACSENWYHYLRRVTRQSRLMIVGSLATVRWKTEVKKGKLKKTVKEQDVELRGVYDRIRAYVDAAASEAQGASGFRWVDAVFVPAWRKDDAVEILKRWGFKTKPAVPFCITHRGMSWTKLADGRFFPASPARILPPRRAVAPLPCES